MWREARTRRWDTSIDPQFLVLIGLQPQTSSHLPRSLAPPVNSSAPISPLGQSRGFKVPFRLERNQGLGIERHQHTKGAWLQKSVRIFTPRAPLAALNLNTFLFAGGDAQAKKAPGCLCVCSSPVFFQSLESHNSNPPFLSLIPNLGGFGSFLTLL